MNELQNAATGGKNQERTRNSVLRQMALLQSMSLEQLREKWLDLYGEEPNGLSLAKLTQTFPEDWDEQRRQFGFTTD